MKITASRTVEASPATAWQVLADVESWPQWTASMTRIERLDQGPLQTGSRVRIEQPGMRPMTWTITRFEPESRFDWETRAPGIRITASHTIESTQEGLLCTNDVHTGGWLAPLFAPMIGKRTRRYVDMETDGWKQRSETLEGAISDHAD